MKAKKMRIIVASFLLFQQVLLPSAVFAIENETLASEEIMEGQPDSNQSEEQLEDVIEEPIVQEEMAQEVTVDSTEIEIPQAVEEPQTIEEETPVVTDEAPEEVSEISEVPPIDEAPLPNYLRVWNETPENLTQLTNHGRSSYLESVLQNAINRKITLGTEVNATATFSVTVPTHSMVERVNGSNGWISSIVTDSPAGMPDEFYTQMYYGNHSTHNNTYTLSNISSNRSDITVSGSVTINSYTATINLTVRRVATSNSTAPVEVRGNVTLGATGVATQYTNIATPRKLTNRTYTNEKIGTLEIDDGRSSAVIGNNIPIQAQRAPVTMSEAEIRSWFIRLPDDPNNYEYSVASPNEGWRPEDRGYMDIILKNKTTGVTETHTTNYFVVDTQAPTGTVKSGFIGLFNEFISEPTRSDLLQFLNEDLKDNWTLSDDIKIELVDSSGWAIYLPGLNQSMNTHVGYIRLEDEIGNQSDLKEVTFQLKDDQGPTANVTTTPVDFEATRVTDLTKEDLMKFFIDGPVDIHTPADKIDISLLDNAGNAVSIKNVPPSTTTIHDATIRLKDEANNHTDYSVKYRVTDTQAPTATFKNEVIDFSTHTSATFSRADLLRFLNGDPADNWTLPENIKIQLVDENGNEFNLSNMEFKEHVGYLHLEDEEGNQTSLQEVKFLAGDTEGPTGNVVTNPVDFQARRKEELTRDDLLQFFTEDPLDNVTASDQIDLSLRNNAGDIVSIVNVAPSNTVYDANVYLQDKAGNKTEYPVNYRVIDTEAPTGAVKTSWTLFEANRKEDLSEDDLRKLFNQLEDNWTEAANIRLQTDFNFSMYAPNGPNAYYPANITATDELGNNRKFSNAMIRVVDTLPPTATFKNEVIDFSSHKENTFSRMDLLQFLNGDPDDNWTLPENIKIELTDENGNEFELDDLEFQEYTGYIHLEDEEGNRSDAHEVKFLAGDNEGPTGNVVTTPVDFQARRKDELTRDDLLNFFTEDPLDNVTESDQIDLSLCNNLGDVVSIVNVAPSDTVYDANVRLQDAKGNKTEYPVNYRVIDTEAPTGEVKDTWTVFEATRERDFTQEELRSLLASLGDNWTEVENITLRADRYLYNAEPNTGSYYYPTELFATDEAGNTKRISKARVRINDTTPPQGVLKNPLVFTKGQEEPAPRDFLDGEPTDNWTLSPDIQVTVTYENDVAFSELPIGNHEVNVRLRDGRGNTQTLTSFVTILEDTSDYIDVTIPMNVSFAESKESQGIVSPTYQIQNNAERPVKVSVSSVVSQANTGKLTEIDLGMKNNMNDQEVMLIKDGKTLNNRRELGTVDGHSTSFSFSLFGTVGENFDFESLDDPLNPVYSMRWNFNAQ